jgi:ubiquitin-like modifier-activating enzyme ATG7
MQYVPFASHIEIPFYASLASHKINHDKLDDSARKVLGLYEIRPSDAKESSCRMQIHGNALTSDEYVSSQVVDHVAKVVMLDSRVPAGHYRAEGMIKNVNTIEEYKEIDKISMLQQAGKTVGYSCSCLYDNH